MVTSMVEFSEASMKPACSFCGHANLTEIMDFGCVALAGAFVTESDFTDERHYPLRVCFCPKCFAVQVTEKVEAADLFSKYFYFSSAIDTLRSHFVDYATEVTARFLNRPELATVVEIGCNDGVLLRPLADQGIRNVIGVDPATNILNAIGDPRFTLINEFFCDHTVDRIVQQCGRADLVVGNNVYAHVADITGTTQAITNLLKDDGVFVFEVHYLGRIIQELQYDMIYHEHLYYYSLLALENHLARYGLVVFDVKPVQIHGGSMRYYVCKQTSHFSQSVSKRVGVLRKHEREMGYDKPETYQHFANECSLRREKLMDLITRLKAKGKRIAGYGASGRANTILQYCGITRNHLEYMIDDAPAKHGYYTPGSHLLIRSNDVLRTEPPDYLLIFAWTFFNEIAGRCRDFLSSGGRLIVPLPDVRITLYPTADDVL
jgi:methylation protein EvaC